MKALLLIKAAAVALLITACSSEENKTKDGTNQNANREKPEQNNFEALQTKANDRLTQWFSFNAGEGEPVTFTSRDGVNITVDPNRVTVDGNSYNGPVTVEYIEIFRIGDMVTANKTPMGVIEGEFTPDAPLSGLFSGGQFYVNMRTEEGQQVDDGTPYTLEVPTELTGGDDDGMTVWTGQEDNGNDGGGDEGDGDDTDEDDVVWEENTDDNGNDEDVPVEGNKYILELLTFGWCNIDKLDQIPGERTSISIDVPDGYNDTNSAVYLAYQGVQNFLFDIKVFDYSTDMFEDPYDNVPIGVPCNVIFVSEQNGQWLYAVKQVTIAGNDIITFDITDLATASDPALIALLNSLP